jgi:hypothetical protein
MKPLFVAQHLHILPDGSEDVKFIGVYSSLASARAAVARLGQQPGFREHPDVVGPGFASDGQGFHISEAIMDRDYWVEGYVTV